jgi:hypothetical protein
MKLGFCGMVMSGFALVVSARAGGGAKTDSLTGLPLYPATSNVADPGDPVKLPESHLCKSKIQTDFYSTYDVLMDATVAWCGTNLQGFKKTESYTDGRAHDTFYNADGTMIVSVTGNRGKQGENAGTYSISYTKVTPGVPEKTILGMNEHKIVCP